jgi:hypothetical protein
MFQNIYSTGAVLYDMATGKNAAPTTKDTVEWERLTGSLLHTIGTGFDLKRRLTKRKAHILSSGAARAARPTKCR